MYRASFLLSALLVACGGDKDGDTPPGEPITVVTYNAGLAVGFVPGAEGRVQPVADAVAALDADVVCLQEVWLPDQIAAIEAAVGNAFPHRLVPAAQQESDVGCQPSELDATLDCVETSCSDPCPDEVVDCLFQSCPFQFGLLPPDCQRCAMANVGEDPLTVRDVCESDPIAFAYEGSFGTMLLSRHPLTDTGERVFESTTNRRSVLHAEVDSPAGPVSVFCTHLTAVFDTIPYPRAEGGWEEEQAVQVDDLRGYTQEVGGALQVLLGDFNAGPALATGILPEAVANWEALSDGWDVPYLDQDAPPCTYCGDNPLNADPGDDRIIDHVLTKGFSAGDAVRVLDEAIPTDRCGDPIDPGALSDHYGVSATLTP